MLVVGQQPHTSPVQAVVELWSRGTLAVVASRIPGLDNACHRPWQPLSRRIVSKSLVISVYNKVPASCENLMAGNVVILARNCFTGHG
jgi:hypothetical protein